MKPDLDNLKAADLRGLNIPTNPYEMLGGNIAELASWGANVMRLHIILAPNHGTYDHNMRTVFGILNEAVATAPGVMFIINLRMDCSCDYAGHLAVWDQIIPTLEQFDNVIGYDVVNEPWDANGPDGKRDMREWVGALPTIHRYMRKMTEKILLIQPGFGGGTEGYKRLTPFGDNRVWLGNTIYDPHNFTHQDIGAPQAYPQPANHLHPDWDLEYIKRENRGLTKFRDQWASFAHWDVQYFIPEAGVTQKCPEHYAQAWYDDVLPWFAEEGWGYAIHAAPENHTRDTAMYCRRSHLEKHFRGGSDWASWQPGA